MQPRMWKIRRSEWSPEVSLPGPSHEVMITWTPNICDVTMRKWFIMSIDINTNQISRGLCSNSQRLMSTVSCAILLCRKCSKLTTIAPDFVSTNGRSGRRISCRDHQLISWTLCPSARKWLWHLWFAFAAPKHGSMLRPRLPSTAEHWAKSPMIVVVVVDWWLCFCYQVYTILGNFANASWNHGWQKIPTNQQADLKKIFSLGPPTGLLPSSSFFGAALSEKLSYCVAPMLAWRLRGLCREDTCTHHIINKQFVAWLHDKKHAVKKQSG